MPYSTETVLATAQMVINVLEEYSGVVQIGILALAICAVLIYIRETIKLRVETVKQSKSSREINDIYFIDRFTNSFFNKDSRVLMMLFEYDLLKFNTRTLTSKHGFPHAQSPRYSALDFDVKWFKKEHTNKYRLINEIFEKNGISEDGYDSATEEQLANAFNELVLIPSVLQVIIEDKGLSGVQVDNTQDILKNKKDLLEIYPHTLGVTFPYFKLNWEAFDNAIEIDPKDREYIKNKYTAYEIYDNLLRYFEEMGNYEKAGIMTIETIYQRFGYYIDMLWRNQEIQKYLGHQGGAEDICKGFQYVQEKCREYEKSLEAGKAKGQAYLGRLMKIVKSKVSRDGKAID